MPEESCQSASEQHSLSSKRNSESRKQMSDIFSPAELEPAMKKCPEWEVSDDGKKIYRTIEFEEFTEAIDCVNDIAEIAEESQHHPDFDIRYSKVTLYLTTHDEGGITTADIEMAQRIDNLVD
jgi:4a-hydroxytetrahydrobiopterin dehydratase